MTKAISVKKDTAPYTNEQIELIRNTVAKGATPDEFKLFMVVAARSGLDPFTKQVHFVKRAGQGTIQTGIDGYRAIAERTKTLAGIDDAAYDSEDKPHPNKASVTVYRLIEGTRVSFTASARWNEYVPNQGQDFMWKKMPYLMLGKVAEALALRKAFPNDLSGLYTHEEMAQADNTTEQTKDAVEGKIVPTDPQKRVIWDTMQQKGYTEADLMDEGFPPLKELTGGREGTASELIDWLFKAPSKAIREAKNLAEPDLPVVQVGEDLAQTTHQEVMDKIREEDIPPFN